MSPASEQPEPNFDEAAQKFDLQKIKAALDNQKGSEVTETPWKYFKGVLCGETTQDIAHQCGVDKKTVSVALSRDIKDCLVDILGLQQIQKMDWSRVPKWLTEAGYGKNKEQFSIDWQQVCHQMLQEQTKRLTSLAPGFGNRQGKVYVPLELVERKPKKLPRPDPSISAEKGSELYHEKITAIEHEHFFEQVLKHSSKHIAIIGEPGAGKTTFLQEIASRVEGLPIWVDLANLHREETLEEHLLENWLEQALPIIENLSPEAVPSPPKVTDNLKDALKKEFYQGRIWLLLDGADERSTEFNPLILISKEISKDWISKARVVLSCRLNVVPASKNVLDVYFDVYCNRDFSYPEQVEQFVDKWFSKDTEDTDNDTEKELGDNLKAELRGANERVQDLIKNPLRLTLLCITWEKQGGKLPETKAGLYQRLADGLYRLKDDKPKLKVRPKKQKKLNKKLGKLAKAAIKGQDSRFRLRESFVKQYLGDPEEENSLFWIARKLGWLNQVGLPRVEEKDSDETVYAFFHTTFQEYFAALAIADWDFFLPRAHHNLNPEPISETYRIFEPQWKEVILLWLGREDVEKEQKEEFIKALVEFKDRCWYFYHHRAYLIAAAGIAEFTSDRCRCNEIVGRIIDWSFCSQPVYMKESNCHGYFLPARQTPENIQQWTKNNYNKSVPSMESAREVLKETDRKTAIDLLTQLLEQDDLADGDEVALLLGQLDSSSTPARNYFLEIINDNNYDCTGRLSAASKLAQINPDNEVLHTALIEIIQDEPGGDAVLQAAEILGTIDRGNTEAIEILSNRIAEDNEHEYTLWVSATSLGRIQPQNQMAIETLKELIKTTKKYCCNKKNITFTHDPSMAYRGIAGGIDSEYFCYLENRCYLSARSLNEIAPNNNLAIQTLVQMLDSTQDEFIQNDYIRCQVAWELGKISSDHQEIAIAALVEIIRDAKNEELRREAIINLGEIGMGDAEAIKVLEEYMNDGIYIGDAAVSLGKVDPGNSMAFSTLLDFILRGEDEDEIMADKLQSILQVPDAFKVILQNNQFKEIVAALRHYMTDQVYEDNFFFYSACHEVIWHCAQNMTYRDFSEAWHQPS